MIEHFVSLLLGFVEKFVAGPFLRIRRERRTQFIGLQRRLVYANVTNDVPPLLSALRQFLITHDLLRRRKFQAFFEKWLDRPAVIFGVPVPNGFTPAEIREIKTDLLGLKI
jgi:hypothetical protein